MFFVDLAGRKDTVRILSDLQSAYPASEQLQWALGEANERVVRRAHQALESGDAERLGVLMTEAQTLMSRGQYYDAAAKFSSAAVANPQNPLSQMGAALAMFGAGEPVSAAFRLRRAMEIFPPIMETQMAVAEMMDAATFDDRLAELDGLLGEQTPNDSQMLLLLATYMHASAGQEDQAKAYAQRLADVASDALMSAYAQFVLTGKRPDEQTDQSAD